MHVDDLVDEIKVKMKLMTDIERSYLIQRLQDGYCDECMGENLPCYCWNDE